MLQALAVMTAGCIGLHSYDVPWESLRNARVIAALPEVTQPTSFAVAAHNNLLIADYGSRTVRLLRRDGSVGWRFDGFGRSPQDLRMPYRIAALPNGKTLVLDLGNARALILSERGHPERLLTPDLRLELGNVVALANGEIAMTGVAREGRASNFSIHVFSSELRYIRSFGALPGGDRSNARRLGAGGLSLAQNGSLLHTRLLPYELVRYSPQGEELARIPLEIGLRSPDSTVEPRRDNSHSARASLAGLVRPKPLVEIASGVFLGGRIDQAGDQVDIFSNAGTLLCSFKQPEVWSAIAAVNILRQTIWVYGEQRSVPVIMSATWKRPAKQSPQYN